jgi:ribosomal protein S27AE
MVRYPRVQCIHILLLPRNSIQHLYDLSKNSLRTSHNMKCNKCEDDELVLMVVAVNGKPRYLCQKCGEMN